MSSHWAFPATFLIII